MQGSFIDRLVTEKADLDQKLDKLTDFINKSPIFQEMDKVNAGLLVIQRDTMKTYSDLLGMRLELLTGE